MRYTSSENGERTAVHIVTPKWVEYHETMQIVAAVEGTTR